MNRRIFFKLMAGVAAAVALKPLLPREEIEWVPPFPYYTDGGWIDPSVTNVFNAGFTEWRPYCFGEPSPDSKRWERWL